MKIKGRAIWIILIFLVYNLRGVVPASAHALLQRSNPEANAVLEKSPAQVELFFSEPLEPQLSTITVYDTNQEIVDVRDVRVDPANPYRMTVSLHSLSDGVYTVTWKAVSTIDGHQTVGTFPFAVGNANAAAVQAIQQSSTARLSFSALLSKFLILASLALLVGRWFFITLIWKPTFRSNQNIGTPPPVWKPLFKLALIGLFLSAGIGILAQAGQTTGYELSFPWDPELGHILTETRLGLIWLVRIALALILVWLSIREDTPITDWINFGVGLGLLLTVSLTSHAATEAKPIVPVLDDWIHLIGMSFWFGGIVYLFTGIHQVQQLDEPQSTRYTSLLIRKFSVFALGIVAMIGVTGLYSAYLRVGSLYALLTSLYGHVLIVKQGFLAGLLIVAAINFLIISPRLNQARIQGIANVRLVSFFRKLLVLDIIFASLLLATVSLFTYIPPAKLPTPAKAGFTSKKKVDDLKVDLNISPALVGQNEFKLVLNATDGTPIYSAKEVFLRFTSSQANIPPSELQLLGDGTGNYSAKGTHLSLPGKWQVQAVVRRQDKYDTYANFDLTLGTSGASANTNLNKQAGGLFLLIGFLVMWLTFSLKGNKGLRYGLGTPLALVVISLGVYTWIHSPVIQNSQINPIPSDKNSINAGNELFTTNCAPCHGESGKGDGPLSQTMNPRPADLTEHAVPGIHTDAQLYEWITNGLPGTRMPGFKSSLSDTDRWNLVNYIRSFTPQ